MPDGNTATGTEVEPKPRTYKITKTYRRIRTAVQVLALVLFLYLLIGTQQQIRTVLPHDLFFLLDPLAGIAAMLASHSWIAPMALGGGILLLSAIIFGRAWCGWLCPLGTILDWMPSRRVKKDKRDIPSGWRQVKNFLFLAVIFGAAVGSLTLIILDPITLFFRSITTVILPLLNSLALAVGQWLYHFEPLQSGVAWFDTSVRLALLGDRGFVLSNITLAVVLAGVLAVNTVRPRFWCRYLCPLGGLLGFVSRLAQVRHRVDTDRCIDCGRCAVICPTGAIDPAQRYAASTAECVTCLECLENCPTRAISFPARWGMVKTPAYQPARRQFLTAVGLAAVGAFTLRFLPFSSRRQSKLIRPPGATEESLETQCLRCGVCSKACPTGAIQPANSPGEWDNVWSPNLVLRHGYCDYSCNACGQACPTGAIAPLPLEEKRKAVIGVAYIDRERCIPFVEERECIVCEEMCPLPDKAVQMGGGDGGGRGHGGNGVLKPHVVGDLCTGCGICEYQCPVDGEAAIRVFPSRFTIQECHNVANQPQVLT